MGYPSAFWRAAGLPGNAFVSHAQAVLAEIYDACDAESGQAALGGFVAMTPVVRKPYLPAMPMLLESQLGQIYGLQAVNGELHFQDWASEPYTCATLDRDPPQTHPVYGNRKLSMAHWGGKLLLGSAETASQSGGYMEGALEAAARIHMAIFSRQVSQQLGSDNAHAINSFSRWVAEQRLQAEERYRSCLNRILARSTNSNSCSALCWIRFRKCMKMLCSSLGSWCSIRGAWRWNKGVPP